MKNIAVNVSDKTNEVSGMFLYARTEDIIQPNVIYQMSGNRIIIKTLDLNCEFFEIVNQLNSIGNYLMDGKQF